MYFITVMSDPKKLHEGWPKHPEHERCWGYYKDLDYAKRAVLYNRTDMWEYLYNYAVIEEIREGVPARAKEIQWYKFNKKKWKYLKIDKPKWSEGTTNWGIG